MLVQLLHPQLRFLIFRQHAQEWICGVWMKLWKHYMTLFAVDACTNSQGSPVCSCARCAPGPGGVSDCALSGAKWSQQQKKRKQSLTFRKVSFQFFPLFTAISYPRIQNKSSTSQTILPRRMISRADRRPEKNSDEYTESRLSLYLFCKRILSNAKRVHICWISNLHISALNLSHASVFFRLKQPKTR